MYDVWRLYHYYHDPNSSDVQRDILSLDTRCATTACKICCIHMLHRALLRFLAWLCVLSYAASTCCIVLFCGFLRGCTCCRALRRMPMGETPIRPRNIVAHEFFGHFMPMVWDACSTTSDTPQRHGGHQVSQTR